MTAQKSWFQSGTDWTFNDIDEAYGHIERIAREKFNISYYPNQIEIISSDQMLDAYCITPDHKLLRSDLRWVEADVIAVGDTILGFDEHGPHRKYRAAAVLAVSRAIEPVYCVTLNSGAKLKVTGEHKWLVRQQKGKDSVLQWKTTMQLRGSNHPHFEPSRIPKVMDVWEEDTSKSAGWLAGMYDGEGNLIRGSVQAVNISQNEGPTLERIKTSLSNKGYNYYAADKSRTNTCKTIGITGNSADRLRFLGSIRPERLIGKVSFDQIGLMKTPYYETVETIELLGEMEIVKITTSTGTFVCDGYPMHNCAVGMPIYYSHWSFGKQYVQESEAYKRGQMGLAYEIVINSNPCISYLMEENSMAMQCLVMAHACFGHNSFFKNNTQFRQWTDAESIIDYLAFAKQYVQECEERYGEQEVERVLDAAHALQLNGIDRYKRPSPLSAEKMRARDHERMEYEQRQLNDLWRTVPTTSKDAAAERERFPKEPEENLLYFIEKNAPYLEDWKRELIRIVRKIAQYFYPQQLTQIMNEGWATFCHYNIMMEMFEEGLVSEGFILEFLQSHTNVIYQRQFSRINPYAIGFAMYQDIKRICEEPTDEDRRWFPDIAGKGNWLEVVTYARDNFKDESFILQYLSPKVMRDFNMFYVLDDDANPTMIVKAIHDDNGYRTIREKFAEQQNVNNMIPYIQVKDVDLRDTRTLLLEHTMHNRQMLDYSDAIGTLNATRYLWGYPVTLHTVDGTDRIIDRLTVS